MLPLFNIVLAAFLGRQNLASDSWIKRGEGVCDLPLAVGNCSRDFPRYYYNRNSGLCYRFTYSGCGGNANRFHTKLHCKQRCVKGWSMGRTKVTATFKDPSLSMCDGCSEKGGVCISGICQCRKGYEMIKNRCVDTNECLWEKCPENSVCKNLVGSFRCECKSGWAGSGLNCSKNREACFQTFDPRYEEKCGDTNEWSVRYFYNSVADFCQRFWHSGCQIAESINFFNDIQSCESLCLKRSIDMVEIQENQPVLTTNVLEMSATTTEMPFPVVCLDEFDQRRRNPCLYGEWTRRFYFDHSTKRCTMFWFDQSCSVNHQFASRNVFVYLSTCMRACEGINPDLGIEIEPTVLEVAPPISTTLQPFHPHLHKDQKHQKHKIGLFPDQHLPTELNPTHSMYPHSTLEPIVRPAPKSTIGVIQAMFTVSNISRNAITENEILEAVTGRPLDEEDLKFDDLTNLIDTSPNWNTIGNSVIDKDRSYDCLVPFDRNLSRSCSNGLRPWTPKYFYDGKKCKLYWNDGCQSLNRNNFDDLSTCQWICEGKSLRPQTAHCMDDFDKAYIENCRDGKYEMRYFFDKELKSCKLMYYGGCKSRSRNIFENLRECEEICVSSSRNTIESCHEPFDPAYRGLCDRNAGYQQRYYFDTATRSCRMFWYGSCKSYGRNIFTDLTSCQWLCEQTREKKIPSHCMDKFDKNYLKACDRGSWSKRFYFNHSNGECESFWFGGCTGLSNNIFASKETCRSLCEEPTLPTEASIDAISQENVIKNEIHRCLEPLKIGNGRHTYPAYYYNKESKRCEPFVYSGINGNGNRFLTLSQCQNTCHRFNSVKADEMICYLPLNVGHGRENMSCIRDAGYRFYFNPKYGKCGRFWFFGCGSNQNNFVNPEDCEKKCQGNSAEKISEELRTPSNCFLKIDQGKCTLSEEPKNVTRFGYVKETKLCQPFEYTSCGGNENRFNTELECKDYCGKLIAPNSDKCMYLPGL